ncbi:MAG: hypothetical protein ACLFP9_05400 [Desulfonatronovibrio sp.]
MQSSGFILLYLVLLSVVLISLFYFVKKRLDARRESGTQSFFKIGSGSEIERILDSALQYNSRFDLHLSGQKVEIFCLFKEYNKDYLLLEPPSQMKISPKLAGREVEVFFKVKPHGEKLSFYKFKSTIIEIVSEERSYFIKLRKPDLLEMDQKRQHFRLEPPLGYIKKLEVRKVSHDRKGNYHKHISKFGEPYWSYQAGDENPPIHLMDISGGGVRLKVSTHESRMDKDFIKENPKLLISLVLLYDQDDPGSAEYFHLIGRLKKEYYDGMGNHVLGLQFEFMAVLDPDKKVITGWKPVKPEEGIEELSTWVVKTHLKLYREKGLTQ